MKLFDFKHWWDYGHEFRFRILRGRSFSFFELNVSQSIGSDDLWPNLYIGTYILTRNTLFCISMSAWGQTIEFSFFNRFHQIGYED